MVEATEMPESPEDDGTLPADNPADQPVGGDDAFDSDDMDGDGDDDEFEGLTVIEEEDDLDDE